MTLNSLTSSLLGFDDVNNSIYSARNLKEWNNDFDMLDVRVCVNREQGLRVLLFQFLKRNHGGRQGSGNSAPVSATAAAGAETGSIGGVLGQKPHIALFIEGLQTHLAAEAVTLSSLYKREATSVCCLDTPAYGLCNHYYLQLSAMYHQAMLKRLKQPMLAMDEWARTAAMRPSISAAVSTGGGGAYGGMNREQ